MDWNKTFIEIAEKFAEHSTCVKRKVGAILVKDLRILSTGYNGTPSGFYNCRDVFRNNDLKNGLMGKTYYDKDKEILRKVETIINHHDFSEKYEIHAEQNCLAIAAKNGISTNNCELYVTTAPCAQCAKLIIASGIKKVYYKEIYKNNFGIELLNECNIMCEQVVF